MDRLYDCPKCGKKESSWDGIQFCGKCEGEYQKEQADWREQEQALLREHCRKTHADDCDCHLCDAAFRPWTQQ